ncbi:restriction endonuclease subunit S, partial [Methanobrevibacter sp.]|uniref:restriction endonuclease subunit S n=1 Tax=Methanobrevibacter sp. TaxID=66852 RepID=UPI002628350D
MTKNKNTPKLRFPEFSDEWEEKKLGDILEVHYGKDYKHLGSGKYPVLGTGGIMTYVDTYLYSKESVLIGRKGSINNPFYINEPFWTVDTLFYTDIHDTFPKFVFYLISTINWFKYNEASGVPSLSASSIKNVKIKISSFAEQEKIANFLSIVDKKISLLEDKLDLFKDFKNFCMQQLFAQKLRFKNAKGENYP